MNTPIEWWEAVSDNYFSPDNCTQRNIGAVPVRHGYHPYYVAYPFDHTGVSWMENTLERGGERKWYQVLVTEPYTDLSNVDWFKQWAEENNLYFRYNPACWWYPGKATRFEFWPIEPFYLSYMKIPTVDSVIGAFLPEENDVAV